jgi:hypothetical protein
MSDTIATVTGPERETLTAQLAIDEITTEMRYQTELAMRNPNGPHQYAIERLREVAGCIHILADGPSEAANAADVTRVVTR